MNHFTIICMSVEVMDLLEAIVKANFRIIVWTINEEGMGSAEVSVRVEEDQEADFEDWADQEDLDYEKEIR